MDTKIRWGILGCAAIAKNKVIPGIKQSLHNEVYGIASRNIETAKATAEQFQIPMAYGSYEELLADDNIDAVYIPLPNHLHKEWSIRAAQAGKHILCEKPLALTADEAAEMVEVAKQNGVLLSEAFMYRYHPRYQQIKNIIAQGDIGDIRMLRGSFTFNIGSSNENVRFHKDWGGGALYDVGCYPMSAARLILGSEPIAITANAMFSERHGGVDMVASGLVEFPNSVSLHFDCGMWAAYRNEFEIVGTDGLIEIPHAFATPTADTPHFYIRKENVRTKVEVAHYDAYTLQADAFARTLRGETNMLFPSEDAIANMKLVEASLRSAETKLRIEL